MVKFSRRGLLMATPLAIAGLGGLGFSAMLTRMKNGHFDPHDVKAPVLNKTVPEFSLPDQAPGQGFTSKELQNLSHPVLINFFASWCVPCVLEMPILLHLKDKLPIWGIAYKDAPQNASGFIKRIGNPYTRIGSDHTGLCAIDWGLTGVPENFLVGKNGIIHWHQATPLTEESISSSLLPTLARISS